MNSDLLQVKLSAGGTTAVAYALAHIGDSIAKLAKSIESNKDVKS